MPTDDDEQLRALGYESKFDRSMSLWENFALGFTYLSPVVGVYSIFAYGLTSGGPPMIFAYFVAGFGQWLVSLVFGEVVSQFPISGGAYSWARRLVGREWAWMVGWIYGWALFSTVAAVSTGAGPFLALLLGFEPTPAVITTIALALVGLATGLNLLGTSILARVALFGFICELLGAIAVGGYLLIFHRAQPLGVIFHTAGVEGAGSYLPAFLTASLVGLFTCYGFEACGDVAEETPNPGVSIPKAMRMTIYIGVAASAFVDYALIVAIPDLKRAVSGEVSDPLAVILINSFGPLGTKAVILVVMVSFLSCVLSLQAAVSRLLFAYARDEMIFGSQFLSRLSERTHVPARALVVSGLISCLIVCLGYVLADALIVIISFAVIGIYAAFQMIVSGALYARLRGWHPSGAYRLGGLGVAVNIAALIYGVGAIVNLLWPRHPEQAWYLNYSTPLAAAAVVATGLAYMVAFTPHARSSAPHGDAWLTASKP